MGDMLNSGLEGMGGGAAAAEPSMSEIISDAIGEGEGEGEKPVEQVQEPAKVEEKPEVEPVIEKVEGEAEPGAEKEPVKEETKEEKSYKEIQSAYTKATQENAELKKRLEVVEQKVTPPAAAEPSIDEIEEQIIDGKDRLLDERQQAYDAGDQEAWHNADTKLKKLEVVEKRLERISRGKSREERQQAEAQETLKAEAAKQVDGVINRFNELSKKYGSDTAEGVKKMFREGAVPDELEAAFKIISFGKNPPRPPDALAGEGGVPTADSSPEEKEIDGVFGRMHEVSL